MRTWATILAAGCLALASAPASAGLQIIGEGITGDVNVTDGESLWSLVGGVTTTVAPGYNDHNAILHNYVVAHSADGAVSVFSLGEINPFFVGTNTSPYIHVSGSDYTLIDPKTGASGRNLGDLTSLEVIAVPAAPIGAGGASTSVDLSGTVASPGAYDLAALKSLPSTDTAVSSVTYTGVSLDTFLNPSGVSSTAGIVVVTATDGYRVVFSLAEFDPAYGGNPDALLAYASTGTDFPGDAVARIVTPLDNRRGRWVSNIDAIAVQAVPEAPVWALMVLGFGGLAALAVRRRRPVSV